MTSEEIDATLRVIEARQRRDRARIVYAALCCIVLVVMGFIGNIAYVREVDQARQEQAAKSAEETRRIVCTVILRTRAEYERLDTPNAAGLEESWRQLGLLLRCDREG